MVDVIVAANCNATTYNGHDDQIPMVQVTNLVSYQFYMNDDSPTNFVFRKTTDGGLTWGAESANINDQLIESGQAHAVYYANWTDGITTGIVHLIWTQLDRVVYKSFDTATDTLGSLITIISPGSAQASHVWIGVVEGGELWCAWNGNDASLGRDVRRAPADGSSWSDPGGTNPMESSAGADVVFIMPARTGDSRDMWLIYFDDTASQITLKAWDNSITDFLAESTVIRAHNWAGTEGAVAQRHSDGHLFLVSHSSSSGSHDLTITEIEDGPIFTNRTNILTGVTGPRRAAIMIDQRTGRIYVCWMTATTNGAIEYSFSDNSGVTWSTPLQFSFDAVNSLRAVWAALSVAEGESGRWMPVWQDTGPEDLETNFDNSIVLGAGVFLTDEVTLGLTYTPVFGGSSFDVQLDLLVEVWKQTINTGPVVMPLTGFQSKALSLNKPGFTIELEGIAALMHPPHPLTASVEHLADDVDLEEAAILFSKELPENRATLTQRLYSDTRLTRSYDGTIESLVLFQEGGRPEWRFKLRFGVAWNSSRPALREWA